VSRTVLYIEDSPDNVRLVERLLRRVPGTRLLAAASAAEGVRAAAACPALILLDNNLPDGTGRDVLAQLAAGSQTAGIPVIIVSGAGGNQFMTELRAAGATDFLPKPFDIQQFLSLMRQYLPDGAGPE
jgi:CheY-like chemotaxis protein